MNISNFFVLLVYDIRVWDGARGWRILGVGLMVRLDWGEGREVE